MVAAITGATPSMGAYAQQQFPSATKSSTDDTGSQASKPVAAGNKSSLQLSEVDQKIIQQLKKRDTEVRAHELAHLAAAGGIARSGASFEYQQGPDGISYAVGGEVNIDTSAVAGNPDATLRKAYTIKSAALAPAQPSAQDLQVAASATAMAANAAAELMALGKQVQQGEKGGLGSQLDVYA
ncbi:MAG: putative metalloprotease CJM1_0395 family protein [Methylovulum sp.]|nr:putative metalloprotease CJM1_0395 family protein [Methylovulum sp.]